MKGIKKMDKKKPQEYIANISKASAYFTLNNGPIKDLISQGKITSEEAANLQKYMQNHLSYLYTVLLEENNLKKFDLVISTMNKFYVNEEEEVLIEDDGFDKFFNNLFPTSSNITMK